MDRRLNRHVESRLKRDQVIWFVTASRNGKPQAVPVWFYWDGTSFLVYSQDGIKVGHVKENPHVEMHLNSDEAGDEVVRASGYATLARRPKQRPQYTRKYRRAIEDLGLTVETFFEQYGNPIVVRRPRFH
jgi:PPOX class probable F420-dependent enzyme